MPSSSVTIKGLDKLQDKLTSVAALRGAKNALKAGALHIKGKVAVYPELTDANRPRSFKSFFGLKTHRAINTWYQRGYGPKWARKDGSVGGRKTSETLGRRWTIASEASGLRQVIGNNASYGIDVQGEKQAHFHAARGWKTTEQVAEQEEATVVAFVQAEVDKAINA